MELREQARDIFDAAVREVEPEAAVIRAARILDGRLVIADHEVEWPAGGGRLLVLAAGKASTGMARGLIRALQGRVDAGVVATPQTFTPPLPPLDVFGAGHPLPDAGSLAAAAESMSLARGASPGDLVLCLLSGGASSLWAAPPDGVSLGHLRAVTGALQRSGATIAELNVVRKHLSRLAGGRLARLAAPAPVLTLAISDVIGAPPDTIGSAPTIADTSSFADALEVLAKHGVDETPAVLRHLQRGAAGDLEEAGGVDGRRFHVIADLDNALRAAAAQAAALGYRAEIVSASLTGEARAVGADIASFAMRALRSGDPEPRAFIWGGETTVAVRGDGRGGRNQEVAVAAARMLEEASGILILAAGTDGIDGPTHAAGGVVDGGTIQRARAAGINADHALQRNDSLAVLAAGG
jgi:glycerate 2-kinase